jgi:hypothetical protein
MKSFITFLYRVLVLLLLWSAGINIATTKDLLLIQTRMMLEQMQQQEPAPTEPSTYDPNARVADVR